MDTESWPRHISPSIDYRREAKEAALASAAAECHMSAIASDCFISVKSIVEKHGLATGESTWIEGKMVPRFLEEVHASGT